MPTRGVTDRVYIKPDSNFRFVCELKRSHMAGERFHLEKCQVRYLVNPDDLSFSKIVR